MQVSKELEMTIANDALIIKSIKVVYKNGSTISGFVRSAKFLPLQVVLCKHEIVKGENAYESLNFDNAFEITIFYNDGGSAIFD